ncbi:MAG TPA: nucleotide sugar dehydrogenase [Polyangiales bacterium]|nr:nucleotide sugar dehydrogenase [Polyangiales bacterium]
MTSSSSRTIGVVGLGYVGLPLAVAFAERMPGKVIGFDINARRVAELRSGRDLTGEVSNERVLRAGVQCTDDPTALAGADFFIVTVPTPVDKDNRPDLGPVRAATETVGRVLRPGAIIVYESTVYPGVTEEICGPLLEQVSGLRCGVDFKLAYSPERIVPGDKERTFEKIRKVVSGQDRETCDAVAAMYSLVVTAGVYAAPSIKVAEAAKVIENTQRDLNIALMNELSIVFDRLGIDTHDVLAAARTKWNFLHFTPGLVGGHCIGVDPYYLTARAEQLGVYPEVILAGRRVNNRMGEFVAHRTVKHLVLAGENVSRSRVLVAGFTFKENVPDVRNTGVVYLVRALQEYAIDVTVWDAHADPAEVKHEYGIELAPLDMQARYAAIVLAVPHSGTVETVLELVREQGVPVLIDVKAAVDRAQLPSSVVYWRL